MCIALSARANTESVTAVSDDWMLTDALGRKACSYEEAGPRDEERFVGLFYWTWHQAFDAYNGQDDTTIENKNITQVLREHPEAINEYYHPAWAGANGKRPGVYYWDEPLFGYYKTTDPWVLRKHGEMLAAAGIDVIFMDCTNGSLIWELSFRALMKAWDQAQKDGVNVPKLAFLLPFTYNADSKTSLTNLYNRIYKLGLYENLWFYWEGKPLILAYPDNLATTGVEGEIRNFFTFRPCQPDYVAGPRRTPQWGWLEVMPTHGFNVDSKTGQAEQCTVGVAQNARSASGGHCCAFNLPNTYGRSYGYKAGFDIRPNAYLYGRNFQEQWDRAINEIQPKIVFVTGWNEWTSGMWRAEHGWSDPLSFVDQFDWDHSRDCEPTKGWGEHGDVYYQQLVHNVRRFKGMNKPAEFSEPKSISLGAEGEWDEVLPRYVAYKGNTMHRDHRGRYNAYYTDNSGRNDITGAQVTHDDEYIYFRVETADKLTPETDPNWMMLFLDTDCNRSTGWAGYEYVINRQSPGDGKAIIEKALFNEWRFAKVGTADYVVNGNVLEIAVPRAKIRVSDTPNFEFKWHDNMQNPGSSMDFYVSGDSAPTGRFNYHYYNPGSESSIAETIASSTLKATSPAAGTLAIECAGNFRVVNAMGVSVATGSGDTSLHLSSPGIYIVNSSDTAVKVYVR